MAKKEKALHEKRKVTFQELGALYAVRGMLKDGVLTHTSSRFPKEGQHSINMEIAGRNEGCGSVGCIGGNMAFVMGSTALTYVGSPRAERHPPLFGMTGPSAEGNYYGGCSRSLVPLFFPIHKNDLSWHTITAKQMLKAIDNWLESGHPRWRQVLTTK
jgi:hypothetical protein